MRILIVEDDHDFSQLMSAYLNPLGECDFSVNGADACESVRLAFEEDEPYDLICLDIMMPHMDGQDALKEIREIEQENLVQAGTGSKIIMITALSDDRNKMKSFLGLCDAYITKPFDKEELYQKLGEIDLITV